MDDLLEPPTPSAIKPILYGTALGTAAMGLFTAAYFVAPNLGLFGTAAIAAVLALLALAVLNAVPTRAGEELAALARGEEVAAFSVETMPRAAPSPTEKLIEEREVRAAELRKETDAIDRASQAPEWFASVRRLADELRELATLELSTTNRRRRTSGLARLRQAATLYRRIISSRGQSRTSRDWGTAQIALGECLLVLGEAESARDEVLEAAKAFTAGLEVAELTGEERAAGQSGQARAEGVLASINEASPRHMGDDFL